MEHIIDEKKIQKYKLMKLELSAYLDGLTHGNWNTKDKLTHFFKHLEVMIFGEEISILDDRIL